MEISKIRYNSSKIEEGDWVDNIPGLSDVRLKVRGANSRTVRNSLSQKMSMAENQNEASRDRVIGEVAAEAVLIDWDNLTNNGEPVEYSLDLAKSWCSNPDYDEFVAAIDWASREIQRRFRGGQEELSKNSKPPSSGHSPGVAKLRAS